MPISFTCPHCGRFTEVAEQYIGKSGPCAGCGRTITIPGGEASDEVEKTSPFDAVAERPVQRKLSLPVILAFTLGIACMCLAGTGIMVALLLPAVQAAREAARRAQCSNNLKQIGLAMHNYHDTFRAFPPGYVSDADGRPMHSWRVYLLPYIEQQQLFEQYNFDEPWDSPANMLVANQMPAVFRCPSSPINGPGVNLASYVVVLSQAEPDESADSCFGGDRCTQFRDILDGTSNTLLVVETRDPVPWTQPDVDLHYDNMSFRVNGGPRSPGSFHAGGLNALFGDGAVRFLAATISEEVMRLLIQPSDGTPIPQHEL